MFNRNMMWGEKNNPYGSRSTFSGSHYDKKRQGVVLHFLRKYLCTKPTDHCLPTQLVWIENHIAKPGPLG